MDQLTLDFPLSIGNLLSRSWGFYKKNIKTIAIIIAVVYLPVNILLGISSGITYVEGANFWQSLRSQYRIASALEQYIGILATIAIAFVVRANLNGESLSPKNALKQATTRWGSTVLTSIILALRTTLWSLLFLIPGLIFGVYWAFAVMAVIFTDKKNNAALEYSKEIVKGRWWKVSLYNLAFLILTILAYPIAAIPFSLFPENFVTSVISNTFGDLAVAYLTVASILFFLRLDKDTVHPAPNTLSPIATPPSEPTQPASPIVGANVTPPDSSL